MPIDFEQDQENVLQKTTNIQTLADQVEKLEDLQKILELQEDNLKNTKKQIDHLSGEVIPTIPDSEVDAVRVKFSAPAAGKVSVGPSTDTTRVRD